MKYSIEASLIGIAAFLCFSLSDAGIKLAAGDFSAFQIVTVVSTISLVPLLIHLTVAGELRTPLPNKPGWMFFRSSLRILSTPAIFYAFATLPMAQVYAIVFLTPLSTVLLSAIILRERIGPKRLAAVAIGFSGVLIAINPSTVTWGPGHFAAAVPVVINALDAIILRHLNSRESLAKLNFWPTINVVLAFWVIFGSDFKPMAATDLLLFSAIAFVMWLGSFLITLGYGKGPVISVAPMQYSQILWASLLGFFLFSETVSLTTLAGSVIIMASGIYLMFKQEQAALSS